MYVEETIKIFPKPDDAYVSFKNYKQRIIESFIVYADTEAMLKEIKPNTFSNHNKVTNEAYQ